MGGSMKDLPLGAIHNGKVFLERIESLNYENPEQFLNGSEELEGLKKCFDALADFVQEHNPNAWKGISLAESNETFRTYHYPRADKESV